MTNPFDDPAHVAMVDLSLGSKAFSEFKASDLELGLDLDKLKEILKNQAQTGYQPGSLLAKTDLVARLIEQGFGTRVFYLSLDGFDTHANQAPAHQQLLSELANGIGEFLANHSLVALLVLLFRRGKRLPSDAILGMLSHSTLSIGLIGLALMSGIRVDQGSEALLRGLLERFEALLGSPLDPGDRLLLTSDGLTNVLAEKTLRRWARRCATSCPWCRSSPATRWGSRRSATTARSPSASTPTSPASTCRSRRSR